MSDRVVMMTNGPRARVGAVYEMPFARPRVRTEVLEHPEYYEYRSKLITFLEEQDHAQMKEDVAQHQAKKQAPDLAETGS